ncbi:MAG: hypothetical protein QOI25_4778 [Mycobacterium sp.]|jgi:hypothetical protein|nr:hypothetical protein [Mycobacterium sp.]
MSVKRTTSKLTLTRESLRELTTADLRQVGGAQGGRTDASVCLCHTDICPGKSRTCPQ